MAKHLFLKGVSQEGKTTLLLECIGSHIDEIGGFLSQRLLDENGETVGFCLVPIEKAKESSCLYDKSIPNIFIEKNDMGWQRYPEIFSTVGAAALSAMDGKKLCFLDEIGGIELMSPLFKKLLYGRLEQDIPCLGVIKNSRNLEAMGTRVNLTEMKISDREQMESDIRERFDGRVLEFTRDKKEYAKEIVMSYLNSIPWERR